MIASFNKLHCSQLVIHLEEFLIVFELIAIIGSIQLMFNNNRNENGIRYLEFKHSI